MSDSKRALAAESEWTKGWRIVLASAIGNGTGISLVFYTFSLFLMPLQAEFGLSRSELSVIQALVIFAALGAPPIGRMTDVWGFRPVFILCSLVIGLTGIAQGLLVDSGFWLGVTIVVVALFSSGASTIALTKPVNAHFRRFRGQALGIVGIGVSVTAIIVSPLLNQIITDHGWRAGFLSLAGLSLLFGMPLTLALMPREVPDPPVEPHLEAQARDWSFLKSRDFWLLSTGNFLIAVAAAGAISQLSPMIQAEGLSAPTAAAGISAFAAGQFVGKLGGGWLLDRFEPRLVSAGLIMIPACGFAVFLFGQGMAWPIMVAAAMIGLMQGADIDIFPYLVARIFGAARYGTVSGPLHALGWIGGVTGILAFGASFDRFGSYAPAQTAALVLLGSGALFLLVLRIPEVEPARRF